MGNYSLFDEIERALADLVFRRIPSNSWFAAALYRGGTLELLADNSDCVFVQKVSAPTAPRQYLAQCRI